MLEQNEASVVTKATLEIFRSTSVGAQMWQPNECFQLFVASPYSEEGQYETFKTSTPPEVKCTEAGADVKLGTVNIDSINFSFSRLDERAQNQRSLILEISNFHNPYSAQSLDQIFLRAFSDEFCQLDMEEYYLLTLNIQPALMPSSAVTIGTSSTQLGYEGPDSVLTVSFTPSTSFSPSLRGRIEIELPK